MINRRKFITSSLVGSVAVMSGKIDAITEPIKGKPIVISTWDAGLEANMGAWKVLGAGGRALDAVEQ